MLKDDKSDPHERQYVISIDFIQFINVFPLIRI